MFLWLLFLFITTATAAVAAATNTSSVPLRILPLGASVTFGVGSSTGNSYRKFLRDTLVEAGGHPVNFVGRRKNGNFTDNNVEATSGFVISQIAESARISTPMFLPNLALIEAGTNNCNSGRSVPDAGQNVTRMIDDIFEASPGVTVILALILKNKIPEQDACRVEINNQYRDALAPGYEKAGKKFVLVDMRSDQGPTTGDLFDSRHPNDEGYKKMAVVWNQGVLEALGKGFITPPVDNGIPLDGEIETGDGNGGGSSSSPQVNTGKSGSTMGQSGAGSPFTVTPQAGDARSGLVEPAGIYMTLGFFLLLNLFLFG